MNNACAKSVVKSGRYRKILFNIFDRNISAFLFSFLFININILMIVSSSQLFADKIWNLGLIPLNIRGKVMY